MKVIYTDVLVIGAGLAGLRMAVGAKHAAMTPSSCLWFLQNVLTLRLRRAVYKLLLQTLLKA